MLTLWNNFKCTFTLILKCVFWGVKYILRWQTSNIYIHLMNGKGTVWKFMAEIFIGPYLSISVADDQSLCEMPLMYFSADWFICIAAGPSTYFIYFCLNNIVLLEQPQNVCDCSHQLTFTIKKKKNEQNILCDCQFKHVDKI